MVRPLLGYEVRPPFVVWNPFTVFTSLIRMTSVHVNTISNLYSAFAFMYPFVRGSVKRSISSRLFDQTCRNALVYMRATCSSYLMGGMTSDFNEFPYILLVARFCSEFFGGFMHAVVETTRRLFVILRGGRLSFSAVRTILKRFRYHRTDQGDVALCFSAAPVSSHITNEARQYVRLCVVSPLGLVTICHSAVLSSQSYCRGCRL